MFKRLQPSPTRDIARGNFLPKDEPFGPMGNYPVVALIANLGVALPWGEAQGVTGWIGGAAIGAFLSVVEPTTLNDPLPPQKSETAPAPERNPEPPASPPQAPERQLVTASSE